MKNALCVCDMVCWCVSVVCVVVCVVCGVHGACADCACAVVVVVCGCALLRAIVCVCVWVRVVARGCAHVCVRIYVLCLFVCACVYKHEGFLIQYQQVDAAMCKLSVLHHQ